MQNNNKSYKIVIIEPSMIISTGLKKLIETRNEFEVVAVVADCFHCLERTSPVMSWVSVTSPRRRAARYSFSPLSAKDTAFVALVYQYIDPDILKQYHTTIDIADDGDKITQKLLHSIDALSTPADLLDKNELSEREKEILISLAKGKINKEIADLHHISVHTVITHRKNIIRKTGIKSVSGLTVYAILNNLIDINEVE
mgnify:CR=1 FL=1